MLPGETTKETTKRLPVRQDHPASKVQLAIQAVQVLQDHKDTEATPALPALQVQTALQESLAQSTKKRSRH